MLVGFEVLDSARIHADDFSEALRASAEYGMAQKAADVERGLAIKHIQPREAVGRMHERGAEVILVVRKKGRSVGMMEQRNNVRVLDPRTSKVADKEAKFDPPLAQLLTLVVPDVLI